MEFERCDGCPGEECAAKKLYDSVERGDVEPSGFVRGLVPGDPTLFIQSAKKGVVVMTCSNVSCGLGNRARIVFKPAPAG